MPRDFNLVFHPKPKSLCFALQVDYSDDDYGQACNKTPRPQSFDSTIRVEIAAQSLHCDDDDVSAVSRLLTSQLHEYTRAKGYWKSEVHVDNRALDTVST